MPSKRNNHTNLEEGRRKPTFEYMKDDDVMTRQALTLRKRKQSKYKETKNRKNHRNLKREMKLERFLRINNPCKAPFQIKVG